MPVTNDMLNKKKEANCIAITPERKYYRTGNAFVKRSLRAREWQVSHVKGTIHVPRQNHERLLNEAAALRLIAEKTNIPVPKLHTCFEDDDAVYLVMEYVEGVGMDELESKQQKVVQEELEIMIQDMHKLRSSKLGGPSGLVILPYRFTRKIFNDEWNLKHSDTDKYVFCHNDLSQQNVIVDPQTLKINAIIDWEYAGYWPEWFDRRFYTRLGPSIALENETDDVDKIGDFLGAQEE